MIESIVVALVVAAITSLCILAYRHPRAYAKLFRPLHYIGSAVLLSLVIWNTATSYSKILILRLDIPLEHTAQIQESLRSAQIPFVWLIPIYFAYIGCLLFLAYLPQLLEDDEKDKR